MQPASMQEIAQFLNNNRSWKFINNRLVRDYIFKDFRKAFTFMTSAAFASEAKNHHPEWSNVYNKVHIELCTHDADNKVTKKDMELAEEFESLI